MRFFSTVRPNAFRAMEVISAHVAPPCTFPPLIHMRLLLLLRRSSLVPYGCLFPHLALPSCLNHCNSDPLDAESTMTDRKGERSHRSKLFDLFVADPMVHSEDELPSGSGIGASSAVASPGYFSDRNPTGGAASPLDFSIWTPLSVVSPFVKSPWAYLPLLSEATADPAASGLVGSLVREEGHVYSLAAAGDLLYTGSDSRNIRVWRGRRELSGFKSSSGLVKAIVIARDRIFTGHQDGKIRVWRQSATNPSSHKRIGTLPRFKDLLRSSFNPSNYVKVRRHRRTVWLRHFDAVSCLCLDEEAGIVYSGSWDRTVKAWRVSDFKCLESVKAHDDAVNTVATGFGGLLFTGSADGTAKVWRRESSGRGEGAARHVLVQALLRQESAVTAVVVAEVAGVVYCGSSDGAVNYWLWEGWRRQLAHGGRLRGHRMAVLCLAAAGRLVVSGSADKTLCVWRREKGSAGGVGGHIKLAVLKGHEGPVKCLAMEEEDAGPGGGPQGPRYVVYSGSLDQSVKVWRVLESEVPSGATPAGSWGEVETRGGERWSSYLSSGRAGTEVARRRSGGGGGVSSVGFGSPIRDESGKRAARMRATA
ncbi:protein JINGUBANG-like [Curcuma longa]|uniref:protein JINGUBANG-like n=1 Tax=Curcuma longa TaxID=136217 RepID=UPI003D9DE73B